MPTIDITRVSGSLTLVTNIFNEENMMMKHEEIKFWATFGYYGNDMIYCEWCRKEDVKGMTTMRQPVQYYRLTNQVKRYLDTSIIQEYGVNTPDGVDVNINDISKHDQENLISYLFDEDETFRSILLEGLQNLIDFRIEDAGIVRRNC